MKYLVTFTQHHEYFVEADSEDEAEKIAHELFNSDMRSPVATTFYDEMAIEPQEEDD